MKPPVEIEHRLVRAHGLAALASLLLVGVLGMVVALKLLWPSLFADTPWLTWGRLRQAHTQGVIFGWLGNAFLAFLYYLVPRLAGRPITSVRLGWGMFVVWQLAIVVAGLVLVLAGRSQPLEWAEFPLEIDAIVIVALVLACVQFVGPFLRTRAGELYVSGWYVIAGLVFTPLAYPLGNVVPEWLAGPAGAAFSGLWTHDAVGLFVTPLALAIAYYVIPAATRAPIYSHALSLVGFWLLVFVYPLNGMHHYLMSPLPMDEQYGAIVASVVLGVNVLLVVANLALSFRPGRARVADDIAVRFVWTGVVFYLLVSVQGAAHSVMPFNAVIHFTDWVVGHAHLAMLGFGSFIAIGALAHAWKHSPLVRFDERMLRRAYWLLLGGLLLMVLDLTIAGIVQAQAWSDERPWMESVTRSAPFWWVRAVSGVLLIGGFVAAGLAFITGATPHQRLPVGAFDEAVLEKDFTIPRAPDERRVPRVVGMVYVIVFLVGVVFFAFSVIVLGINPMRELDAEIARTVITRPQPPTEAEQRGRAVYMRDGCAYCHTQQVRALPEDVRRFGMPSEAWEGRFDVPHLLGTRRIGPDLAREAGRRPDDWHLAHLWNPQLVEPGSVMPRFPWLFDGAPTKPTREARDLVAYLQSLGRERKDAGKRPGVPHCNCKEGDPTGPTFKISKAPGDVERGHGVFEERCSGCHGADGRGDGDAADLLEPRPADLTVAAWSAERLSDVVWNGVPGTAMPAFRELSKEDQKAVIAYVGSRSAAAERPRGDLALGRVIYEVRCAACHGTDGAADGPADMWTPRLPAAFRGKQPTEARARDVLAHGIRGTAMVPMAQNLSPAQRDAVIAYVRSLFTDQPRSQP